MERTVYGRFLSLPIIKLQPSSTVDSENEDTRRYSESATLLKRPKHRLFNRSGSPNRESIDEKEDLEPTFPSSEVIVEHSLRPLNRESTSFILTRSLSVDDSKTERKRRVYTVGYFFFHFC